MELDSDPKRIEEFKKKIILCAAKDVVHIGDPLKQIETLSLMVDKMLKDNKDGRHDQLIGFYANIGKSLASLLRFIHSKN